MPSPHDSPGDRDNPGYSDRPLPPLSSDRNVGGSYPDDRDEGPPPRLGSLAQKARGKQLNQARWILIVIGILTIVLNVVVIATLREAIRGQINQEIGKLGNVQVDRQKVKEIEDQQVRLLTIVNGVAIVLGIVFILCGVLVYKFPIPATLVSLILYIVANLGFAALDPTNLARGFIIKVIIVVALVKAVQAAFAYEKEARIQDEARFEPG